MTAKRLSDADAKTVLDAVADFDRRFKEHKPAAGSESAVQRMVEGKPPCDLMSPGLANATRQRLTGIQSMFAGFGALQSIIFKGVVREAPTSMRSNSRKPQSTTASGSRPMEKSTARTSIQANSPIVQTVRNERRSRRISIRSSRKPILGFGANLPVGDEPLEAQRRHVEPIERFTAK
jgi:hypothetical protein